MDISLFPKGRYVAKNAKLSYKYPHVKKGSEGQILPFAINIERTYSSKDTRITKNGVGARAVDSNSSCWELEAFRPSPYFEDIENGADIIVLYEKVNTSKLCSIPRYIYLTDKGMWFVNTR